MKYVFVIQFREDKFLDFQSIEDCENYLIECVGADGDLDGHDFGSGEVNFFINTNRPAELYAKLFRSCPRGYFLGAKMAYRLVDGEEYHILWPENLENFRVR